MVKRIGAGARMEIFPAVHTDYSVYKEAGRRIGKLLGSSRRVILFVETQDLPEWRRILRGAAGLTNKQIYELSDYLRGKGRSIKQLTEEFKFVRAQAKRAKGTRRISVVPVDYPDKNGVHDQVIEMANMANIVGQRAATNLDESYLSALKTMNVYARSDEIRNSAMVERIAKALPNDGRFAGVFITGERHYLPVHNALVQKGYAVAIHGNLSERGRILREAEEAVGRGSADFSGLKCIPVVRYALLTRWEQSERRQLVGEEFGRLLSIKTINEARKLFSRLPVIEGRETRSLLRLNEGAAVPETRVRSLSKI